MTSVKYSLVFFIILLVISGCSSDKVLSPESLMIVESVNSGSIFVYDESNDNRVVSIGVKTVNGVGVNFVGYKNVYYYADKTPITEAQLNKNGVLSQNLAGYSSGNVEAVLVTDEVLDFVKQNETTTEDDISSLLAKVELIGFDENDNQVSVVANVEIMFK
ncbi:MAG: hypothetical protein C0601_01980 [Candidatus Muiribacterium halophilum]|uniref:Uncharacterized protein n=1 Tax=Muiribacterium halophilum TaxID=2053465 RepID=A0A2N5ZKZ3_MUIH1|nr:MAG: hypothetical protein C0601_01980 [Candidatus Muirbacterium halophilum]